MTEERMRAALREFADAIPVSAEAATTAPDRTMTAPPRPTRRVHWAPALVAAAVTVMTVGVAAVPVVLLGGGGSVAPPGGGDGVGLPDRFAGGSVLTADVSRAPVGPAITVYSQVNPLHEDFAGHVMVLAADRDAYRRVGVAECRSVEPRMVGLTSSGPLLSPDGAALAVVPCGARAGYGVNVVDLTTGGVRLFPAPAGSLVRPLAWSPDSQILAWAVAPDRGDGFSADARALNTGGRLELLHLRTGVSTVVPNLGIDIWEAAFSPDGRELAVQSNRTVMIIDLGGFARQSFLLPAGYRLAGQAAWSPFGRAIAAVARWGTGEAEPERAAGEVVIVARLPEAHVATAPDETVTVSLPGESDFGGWRTGDTFVVRQGNTLLVVPVDGGPTASLSTVDELAGGFQFASRLLASATVREAGTADRGPWPVWWSVMVVTVCAMALTGATLVVVRRRRRAVTPARGAAGTPQT